MSRNLRNGRHPEPSILLVEDEVGTQDALATLLELDGWRVVCASDGEEALDHLDAFTPDLILTDYMMPNLDGLALMEQIRNDRRLESVPVVLVSATRVAPELRQHARAFLKKPVELSALRKILHTLVPDRDPGAGPSR